MWVVGWRGFRGASVKNVVLMGQASFFVGEPSSIETCQVHSVTLSVPQCRHHRHDRSRHEVEVDQHVVVVSWWYRGEKWFEMGLDRLGEEEDDNNSIHSHSDTHFARNSCPCHSPRSLTQPVLPWGHAKGRLGAAGVFGGSLLASPSSPLAQEARLQHPTRDLNQNNGTARHVHYHDHCCCQSHVQH